MGLSLKKIGSSIADIFDANSGSDVQKRLDRGEAASYQVQQQNRGIGRVSNNPLERAVNTAKAFGEGVIEAPKYIGQGVGEALAYNSKDSQAARQSAQNLQASNAAVFSRLAKNNSPAARNLVDTLAGQSASDYQVSSDRNKQIRERVDPLKAAAAIGSTAFDVMTLGVGTGATQLLKQASKQGSKQFGKVLLKESAKTGLTGASSGAITPVVQKGNQVSLKDIAVGAAGGAVVGSAIPGLGYGIAKGSNKAVAASTANIKPVYASTGKTPKVLVKQQTPALLTKPLETTAPKASLKQSKVNVAQSPTASIASVTDKLHQLAGIDTTKGLVHENPLITKTGYGAVQQGYNKLVNAGRDKVSNKIRAGMDSQTEAIAKAAAAPNIGFANYGSKDAFRQVGIQRTSDIENAGRTSNTLLKDLNKGATPEEFKRVYQVLETPDFLARKYGDGTAKLSVDDLTPAEQAKFAKLVEYNKIRNDVNLETGRITPEKHAQYADGMHSPRIYDQDVFGKSTAQGGLFDNAASKKRTDVTKINDDIFDTNLDNPYQASMLRMESALRNKSNLDALSSYEKNGLLKTKAPNSNYVKLEGTKYGQFEGKYLDKQVKSQIDKKQIFNTKVGQAVGDVVDAYQGTVLGKLDRLNKATKTVLSPATSLGNLGSNIFAFSGAAGVNPATAAVRTAQAAKQLIQHKHTFNSNAYRAEKAGLFSGDTGRQINGKSADGGLKTAGKSNFKKVTDLPGDIYGGTDKSFALGLFNELKSRGLSDADAVRRTHLATQDYSNAGRGINLLADSPVLGKPFARFTPELVRIAKNAAIYNPVGTTAKVGALAYGANKLSTMSGETEEERKARENGVGQTQLPGTAKLNQLVTGNKNLGNVSLNVPVNGSSVNVARISGLNYPIEPGGNANTALVRQLSPVVDPTRTTADGKQVIAPNQLVSSMTFRPLADQIANRDFMGRQITDPDNKIKSEIGTGKSQFENADGSRQSPGKKAELDNRLRSLKAAYLPGFSEVDANRSAAKGQPDYYGKVRTKTEAALRSFGLKTESNSPEVRQKRVSSQDFYEGKDKQVKTFLQSSPEIADAYFKFNDSSRDRNTNKKSSSLVTPERWSVVKGETSGKLFNQLRQEAIDARTKDPSKPVDPIFEVNDPARVKELINLRATAPGENVEREEILRATTDWYPKLEAAEKKYYEDSKAYFDKLPKGSNPAGENDRTKAYREVPYPVQAPLEKQYYQEKAKSAEAGKAFFKANADALSASFASSKLAKLKNINTKREMLGLAPIDPDTFNNVTFGYEDDERKVARELFYKLGGYGGKGGNGKNQAGSAYKYAVSQDAGGAIARPKVSVKQAKAIQSKATSMAAPKVSIKKSRV